MGKKKFLSYILDEKGFFGLEEEGLKTCIYTFKVIALESRESEESIFSIEIDNKVIDLKAVDIVDLKSFKKKVGMYSVKYTIWNGCDDDYRAFINIVLSQKVKTTKYLKSSGFYFKDNNWIFACNGGVIDKNNNVNIEYSTNRENNDSFIKTDIVNDNEIMLIKEDLLNYNDKGIVASQLGYVASLFLRERLYKLGIKSPCLTSFGNPGSGKTMSIDKIIIPILNMNIENKLSAKSLTPFSFLVKLCESNFFPVIIDDLKRNIMNTGKIDLIVGKINESYDRPTIERGTASQIVNKYEVKASSILSGETNTLDTSNNDRIINVTMSKKDSMLHYDSFLNICNNEKILRKIGKTLLINALIIDDNSILQLLEENRKIIEENSSGLTTRMILSLAITATGIDMFEVVLGKIEDKKEFKLSMIKSFCESTLDEEGNSKDTTSIVLEEINKLAYLDIIKQDFKVVNSKKYQKQCLAMDLNIIFDKLDKYNKDLGKLTRLQYSSFVSLIKKEEYYLGYELVSIDGSKRRCYFFDIDILANMNLDLDSLGVHNFDAEKEEEREAIKNETISIETYRKEKSK